MLRDNTAYTMKYAFSPSFW